MKEILKRPKIEKKSKQDYVILEAYVKKGSTTPFTVRIQFLGKRERFHFATLEEANAFMSEKRNEIKNRSTNYRKGDVAYFTLGNVFREMNQHRLKSGLIRLSTSRSNEQVFKSVLSKYQNHYTGQIDHSIWQEIVQDVKRRESPSTLEKGLGLLKTLQKYLIKNNIDPMLIDFDDCKATYVNKKKPKSSYEMNEYDKLIDLLDDENKMEAQAWIGLNLLILGINSGLRIGELLALQFEKDVDLETGRIIVSKTYSPSTKLIGDPKTFSSNRTVTFNLDAKIAIINLMKHAKKINSKMLIAPKRHRTTKKSTYPTEIRPISYFAAVLYIRRALKLAGLPILNSQAAMRKTHITNIIRNAEAEGVPFIEAVTVAQQRAGHKKLTTTLDDYTKTSTVKEDKLIQSMSRSKVKREVEPDLDSLSHEALLEYVKLLKK